jgi:hypothetical protein
MDEEELYGIVERAATLTRKLLTERLGLNPENPMRGMCKVASDVLSTHLNSVFFKLPMQKTPDHYWRADQAHGIYYYPRADGKYIHDEHYWVDVYHMHGAGPWYYCYCVDITMDQFKHGDPPVSIIRGDFHPNLRNLLVDGRGNELEVPEKHLPMQSWFGEIQ